jgi:hypothetical protein
MSSTEFHDGPNFKFHGNLLGGSRADTCRLTDKTKLKDAFREYGNERKMGGVGRSKYLCDKS